MIEAKNLQKKYGSDLVLDIPELVLKPGEHFGLVGNNGAGKTTFFSLILDIIEATEGQVFSSGRNVKRSNHWQSYTGAYIDERFLIGFLSAEEYFEFVSRSFGLTKEQYDVFLERFEDFFNDEILGKHKYIRDFSRGNQKKIGIAASLMSHPAVLVLDEPFPHLDPTSVMRLKKIIQELKSNQTTTVLISSHDLNHVTELCDRIAILEKGSIAHDLYTDETTLEQLESYFSVQV